MAEKPVSANAGAGASGGKLAVQGKGTQVAVNAPRRSSYGTFSRVVLVAVDPSESARYAFEWYLGHTWKKDDLIVLCYCPEVPKLPMFSLKNAGVPHKDWTGVITDMNTKIRKLEEEYEGRCIEKKLKYKIRGEAYKNPGEGILKLADDENADLIVIGSRSVSIKRTLMGSVGEFVTRNSVIPVLIVPPKTTM